MLKSLLEMRNEWGQQPVIWCQRRKACLVFGLFRICWVVHRAQRRKELEDVLSVSSSSVADSLMHAQKKEIHSLFLLGNSWEPGTKSDLSHQTLFLSINKSVCWTFTHSCLAADSKKDCELCPENTHNTIELLLAKNNISSLLFVRYRHIEVIYLCIWQRPSNLGSKCSFC